MYRTGEGRGGRGGGEGKNEGWQGELRMNSVSKVYDSEGRRVLAAGREEEANNV